jgi:hypothetical protein
MQETFSNASEKQMKGGVIMEQLKLIVQEWSWAIVALVLAYEGMKLLVFLVRQFFESIL